MTPIKSGRGGGEKAQYILVEYCRVQYYTLHIYMYTSGKTLEAKALPFSLSSPSLPLITLITPHARLEILDQKQTNPPPPPSRRSSYPPRRCASFSIFSHSRSMFCRFVTFLRPPRKKPAFVALGKLCHRRFREILWVDRLLITGTRGQNSTILDRT